MIYLTILKFIRSFWITGILDVFLCHQYDIGVLFSQSYIYYCFNIILPTHVITIIKYGLCFVLQNVFQFIKINSQNKFNRLLGFRIVKLVLSSNNTPPFCNSYNLLISFFYMGLYTTPIIV